MTPASAHGQETGLKSGKRPDSRQKADNGLKAKGRAVFGDNFIMGLDISTKSSGWAVLDGGGILIASGVIVPEGDVPERLQTTRNELAAILNKYCPTLVAIEDMIAFRNGHVVKIINQFVGVAYLTCFDYNGNDVYFIASSSMKAAIGVNPRALKKDGFDPKGIKEIVYNKICDLFHFKISELSANYKFRHDIADAILCAYKLYLTISGNKQGEK